MRVAIRSGYGRHGRFEAGFAPQRRRRDYYRDLITSGVAGKEIRVFGLLPWLRARYRAHALDAVLPVWSSRRRNIYGAYLLASPIWLALAAVTTVGAARAAASGSLTLGELVYVLQGIVLVGALGAFIVGADHETEHGLRAFTGLERLERRVATEAWQGEGARGSRRHAAQGDPLRARELRLRQRWPRRAARARPDDRGRTLARDRRAERRRQDDARQAPRAALRAAERADHRRRARPCRVLGPRLAPPPRGDLPGLRPLRLLRPRQRRFRRDRGHGRRSADPFRARSRRRARARRRVAARARDDALARVRRRHGALGRAVAAHRDRPRADGRRGRRERPRPRRADGEPRRARRGRVLRPLPRTHARADDDPHLAPLLNSRRAERIVVLEDGRVVEDGTHAELLAAGGR